jgi:16S rRNA (uracil1498-N3)-methyltransferase
VTRLVRCPLEGLAEGVTGLSKEAARYLTRVHRFDVGSQFVAFDPAQGVEAEACIVELEGGTVRCAVGPVRAAPRLSGLAVTLLQGLGKGDRVEQVVRDTTQLGVQRIVLVESERSVVKWLDKGRDKHARYRSIAVQSCRQCGRGDAPELMGPMRLAQALALVSGAAIRLCFDAGAGRSLKAQLEAGSCEGEVAALIGPEGGLSENELTAAEAAGFCRVSLGPFTLRTETAAVAVLAVLAQYRPVS